MIFFSKKSLFPLLLLVFSVSIKTEQIYGYNNRLIQDSKMLFTAAYRWWFGPDRSFPTIDKLNVVTFLPIDDSDNNQNVISDYNEGTDGIINFLKKKDGIISIQGQLYKIFSGIPEEISTYQDPIVLYSAGYSNLGKPYALSVYNGIKAGSIQGPCVIFEYATDSRRAFNFCQEQDLHCLSLVYAEIIEKNPTTSIILKGGSKGAAVNLRFLAEAAEENISLDNIKAVIADSPPVSVQSALKYYGGIISHMLCRFVMPNYNPRSKTIMDAKAFPTNIPILLSSLPFDAISDLSDVQDMKSHLDLLGANIEHFVSKGIAKDENGKIVHLSHGKLGRAEDYQESLKEFLIKHGLRKAT